MSWDKTLIPKSKTFLCNAPGQIRIFILWDLCICIAKKEVPLRNQLVFSGLICENIYFRISKKLYFKKMKRVIIRGLYYIKVTIFKGFQIISSSLMIPRVAMITAMTASIITFSVGLGVGLSASDNNNNYPDLTDQLNNTDTSTVEAPHSLQSLKPHGQRHH